MALTPEDVVNKRFQPTKFREGYDQDEVDDFLDEIVVELRRLNQENDELRKKLAESGAGTPASSAAAAPVVEKVPAPVKAEKEDRAKAEAEAKAAEAAKAAELAKKKEAEQAAVPARGAATPAAESAAGLLAVGDVLVVHLLRHGEQQRDKIIAEAQIEASSLVNDAQEKSRKILGALEQQRSVLERKVEQLRGFERDYRSRLKAYIEGQLRDLDARGSVAAPEVEANS